MNDPSAPPDSPSSPAIRVAIVDDQSLVREGLRTLMSGMKGIEVVIAAASGTDLLEQLSRLSVDVAVVDVRMPVHSGFEVVRRLRRDYPAVRSILLTTFDERGLLAEAVRAGAEGLLLKGVSPQELCATIEAVARGETVREPIETEPLRGARTIAEAAQGVVLTDRERAILRLAAGGHSNKEIARTLGLVEGTVKNYMSDALIKLDARDRTQAVLKALASGLL
jgi:DNA-binding NarL/FixJ family response regulator